MVHWGLHRTAGSRPGVDEQGGHVDLSKLTNGEKVVGIGGVLLVIDLLFLPWHSYHFGLGRVAGLSVTVTAHAVEGQNAFLGVLALLATIAMVAVVVVTRFTSAKVPDLPVPLGQAMFFVGIGVIGLLVLKLISATDNLGFGAWLGLLLGGGVAYGGVLYRQEAGTNPTGSAG